MPARRAPDAVGDKHGRRVGVRCQIQPVFVCDHRKHPGMAAEDEAARRSSGDVSDIAGLGTAAFQTPDGALFARLDGSWTVQILVPKIAQARLDAREADTRIYAAVIQELSDQPNTPETSRDRAGT